MSAGDDGLSPIPILHLESAGASAEIRFAPRQADGSMIIRVNDDKLSVSLVAAEGDSVTAVVGGRREAVRIRRHDQTLFVHDRRGVHTLTAIPYLTYISAAGDERGTARPEMMGMIRKVNVAVGDRVKVGDVAAILKSMKMELRISSQVDGVVSAVNCRAVNGRAQYGRRDRGSGRANLEQRECDMRLGAVNYETRGKVALLTLDEPHKLNALSTGIREGIPKD